MNNPYVGPRAFRDGETLYGRGDDAARLFHLLLADRIVLLYSPSGAGKTSLLEAQLTKRLREEEFHVIYDIRMHREPALDPATAPLVITNRYVLSTMLSIEKALTEKQRLKLADLAAMSLPEYLEHVRSVQGGKSIRLALLFDQFEEIFKVDETDVDAKRAFFTILGEALDNRSLYAVFAMREDSIALLDDYCHLIPGRLRARQRLSLLTSQQAIEAIRKPAEEGGVDFKVADELARDLSRTTTMLSDGSTRVDYGQYVEPVQLQVVCFTVWEKPRKNRKVIDDLSGVSVDTALADYYNGCVAEVALNKKLASERDVRDWFSRSLITPRGIRAQVLLDKDKSEGLSNAAIDVLVGKHIVRREQRGGRTWFELAHDRLVNPIRTSNERWNAMYLTPLQSRAAAWHASNQDSQLLLCGRELVDAIALKNTSPGVLTAVEQAFIDRSRVALADIERAAVEWELAGRTPTKLLRGDALKSCETMLRSKGEYQLTPEARALLAESRAARRSRRVVAQIAVCTLVVLAMSAGYATKRLQVLREKDTELAATRATTVAAKYLESGAKVETRTLREAIDAQERIETLAAEAPANPSEVKPVVRYYFLPGGDNPKLRSALAELGFQIRDLRARASNATNCIWYGADVPESDVKLLAYAVIRAGEVLQSVQPIPRIDSDRNILNFGPNQFVAGEPSLTTDEIERLELKQLMRPRARLVRDDERGTVKYLDQITGWGAIAVKSDTIPFGPTPGNPEIHLGDRVTFALYENANLRYAVNVRPTDDRPIHGEQRAAPQGE